MLSISFKVTAMRADEFEHTITIEERRRQLPELARQGQGGPVGGPVPQRAPSAPPGPSAVITLPVTPDQFASLRIGQDLELEPSYIAQAHPNPGGLVAGQDLVRQFAGR